ncbi:MAG: ASKHA domain-containing protein [Acutalibacteraceae bacterium]
MHKVKITQSGESSEVFAENGEKLSSVLIRGGFYAEHPCGGRGLCRKCTVTVNGEKELSCRYKINSDISVILPDRDNIFSACGVTETKRKTDKMCFAFDIGTTTLALALVSVDGQNIIEVKTKTNPQRLYGADVMSRIEYCRKNGAADLQSSVICALNEMTAEFCREYELDCIEKLYAAGNTTMLHLFFGIDCSAMGESPYTPAFLDSRREKAAVLGISRVEEIISLPNIAAFIGADIFAGLNFAGLPQGEKYNILIDLGTNAEIVLYSKNHSVCTAAAAGPCFEGANISCGMSAANGAICSFSPDGSYSVIGGVKPCGICATGLIDIVAALIENGIADETGFMDCGAFEIAENVSLTQEDIRQFQLAKSAVYSAVLSLMKSEKVSFEEIEAVFIAGGFAAKINIDNAVKTGLIPAELRKKVVTVDNSSLLGTAEFACGKEPVISIENAEYTDLSQSSVFSDLFIENMLF